MAIFDLFPVFDRVKHERNMIQLATELYVRSSGFGEKTSEILDAVYQNPGFFIKEGGPLGTFEHVQFFNVYGPVVSEVKKLAREIATIPSIKQQILTLETCKLVKGLISAYALLEDVLDHPDKVFSWLPILSSQYLIGECIRTDKSEEIVARCLKIDHKIKLDHTGDGPHSMSPQDMMKSWAIQQLAHWDFASDDWKLIDKYRNDIKIIEEQSKTAFVSPTLQSIIKLVLEKKLPNGQNI